VVTRCHLCGGATRQQEVTAENWWGDRLALIEDEPAWVCHQCGEQYFDSEVSRELDRLQESPPATARTVPVPVYSFRTPV
jgi:YgiT-type zinc finger domain-containing protein